MPYTHSRDLLSPLQIECIGVTITEWALLEATVSVAIWDYLGLDRDRGLIVTSDLGSLQIKMLESLARVKFRGSPDLERIMALTREMEALNTERNKIAHSIWATDFVATRMRAKRMSTRGGSLKEAPVTMSEEDLMAIYSRVTATISDLEDFQNDHKKVFSTRPHG